MLMNSEFILDQAARFAARLKSESWEERASSGPSLATGFTRLPTERNQPSADFLSPGRQLKKIQEKRTLKEGESPRKMKSQSRSQTCAELQALTDLWPSLAQCKRISLR